MSVVAWRAGRIAAAGVNGISALLSSGPRIEEYLETLAVHAGVPALAEAAVGVTVFACENRKAFSRLFGVPILKGAHPSPHWVPSPELVVLFGVAALLATFATWWHVGDGDIARGVKRHLCALTECFCVGSAAFVLTTASVTQLPSWEGLISVLALGLIAWAAHESRIHDL